MKCRLDVRIENLASNVSKIERLLDQHVVVTEKVDGIKVNVIRNNTPYDAYCPERNWIVSYKNNILGPEDFAGLTIEHMSAIKESSIGVSQFKLVWDRLCSVHRNCKDIPTNTEFFIEFVMRKATLLRQYITYHAMILIATSPTSYRIQSGRVFSQPSTFDVSQNKHYAALLSIVSPRVLFRGKLRDVVNGQDGTEVLARMHERFLRLPSQFGGQMEGVVLSFDSGEVFKVVQEDQYDKSVRLAVRSRTEPLDPVKYWTTVRKYAELEVEQLSDDTADGKISSLSKSIYGEVGLSLDGNRTSIQTSDDIFLTAKNIVVRASPGNNGALFIGRFSPLTIAHYSIISSAIKQYDTVTVNIVKAKTDARNPFPIDTQIDMMRRCFGDMIAITVSSSGNLATIIPKSNNVINVILAGSDRAPVYADQMKRNKDVRVVEIPRVDDISGTLARDAIRNDDVDSFRNCTPFNIWDMYDELRSYV